MRDPPPRDLRDVHEPVHAAEIHEGPEIGEGADAAGEDRSDGDLLARQGGLLVLLGLEERDARDDDAAPVLGVLEDAEVVGLPDEGRERGLLVTAEVDLRDRAEGAEAVGASDHHVEAALVPRHDLSRDGNLRLGSGAELGLRAMPDRELAARGARPAPAFTTTASIRSPTFSPSSSLRSMSASDFPPIETSTTSGVMPAMMPFTT